MDSLLKNALLTALGFLLVLGAAVAQQNPSQTGSATGPATSSSPVAVPGNASGAGTVQQDTNAAQTTAPESAPDDRAMAPEDGDDDQSMTPEDANAADDAAAATGNTAAPVGAAPANSNSNNGTVRNAANEGCWARLYDAENFIGHSLTLVGPAEMPNMDGTFRSIEVGPNATLVAFSDDGFADETGRFGPGNRAANLRGPEGSDEFESLRLTCTRPAAR
jgi:hypothetical protein